MYEFQGRTRSIAGDLPRRCAAKSNEDRKRKGEGAGESGAGGSFKAERREEAGEAWQEVGARGKNREAGIENYIFICRGWPRFVGTRERCC